MAWDFSVSKEELQRMHLCCDCIAKFLAQWRINARALAAAAHEHAGFLSLCRGCGGAQRLEMTGV